MSMFLRGAVQKIGSSLAKPEVQMRIGDIARGISRASALANRLSGGTLKTAVEAIPFGSLALKGAKYGLGHAEDVSRFLGRAYEKMSSAPK